jgi:hypothetical protein
LVDGWNQAVNCSRITVSIQTHPPTKKKKKKKEEKKKKKKKKKEL